MNVMLKSDIQFNAMGKSIDLKAGQMIYVDTKKQIAYIDGIHFKIHQTEYTLPN